MNNNVVIEPQGITGGTNTTSTIKLTVAKRCQEKRLDAPED